MMDMNRRDLISIAGAAGVSWAAPAGVRGAEPLAKTRRGAYFDIHLHLTQRWHGDDQSVLTATSLLRWMDAHDIARAAVLPLVSPEAFWYPVTTEFVLRETEPYRDRLIPFCAIDPRTLTTHLTSTKEVVDLLSRYRDAGARGFGEHKPMLPIDDPLCMRLYEACEEVNLPLLFHLDNNANIDQPGLPGLAKALAAFPNLPFIGHGKGWWASISGELTQPDLQVSYPRGPVAPGGAVDRLMDAHANLYGDLSSSGAHAMLRDSDFGGGFLLRRSDRLLFGTDYYDPAQTDFPHFELFHHYPLPAKALAAITYGNAHRILGLGDTPGGSALGSDADK
ncbi:MAG: amidohydrolase family protein [Pirellulales bacterium]|nr:amidohydrolase family protein [Pirellulales bacterium]